jgi:hypothetical protein
MSQLWAGGAATQPTMAVIGGETIPAEIVITTHYYGMTDPIDAFKTLMKIYHTLKCAYPERSKIAWTFMSTQVFELKDGERATSSSISLKNRLLK